MFEGERFWFLLMDGEPVNVVRCDAAVGYHRWSHRTPAWVQDNGLFLEVEGPDVFRSEARPVERDEALRWLVEHTAFRPEIGERVITLDAELRLHAGDAAGGDRRRSIDPQATTPALAELLRTNVAERDQAERLLAELAEVDAGRGQNPWFSDDRQDMEGAVRSYIHRLFDVGDDPNVSLDTERILRDAVALARGLNPSAARETVGGPARRAADVPHQTTASGVASDHRPSARSLMVAGSASFERHSFGMPDSPQNAPAS